MPYPIRDLQDWPLSLQFYSTPTIQMPGCFLIPDLLRPSSDPQISHEFSPLKHLTMCVLYLEYSSFLHIFNPNPSTGSQLKQNVSIRIFFWCPAIFFHITLCFSTVTYALYDLIFICLVIWMMSIFLTEAVLLSEGTTFLSEFCILFYSHLFSQWIPILI